MKKLFLDDEREPKDAYSKYLSGNNPVYLEDDWTVVRSLQEFMRHLKKQGMPDLISFDHDLGFSPNTGYDCAHALVDFCLSRNIDLPLCMIHTGNPVGRENIYNLLNKFSQFKENNAAQKIQKA